MHTPRFWQHRNLTSSLLLPLAEIYRIGAAIDRALTPEQAAQLPVVCVGNATAGGAGKTPTTIALATMLHSMGHAPHLITRGYGSAGRHTRRAETTSDWREMGDEALLLAAAAPTWVGGNRLASATAAQAAGASLVIADDALQHHALKKDLTFMVVDGAYGFGNGRILPAGPLREPVSCALARCDAVVLIGESDLRFDIPTFRASLAPQGDVSWLKGQRVLAFAGLARPEKFYTTLRALGAELVAVQDFPDHQPFTPEELDSLIARAAALNAIPVATAKDAVKFPSEFKSRIRVLEVALQWADPAGLQNWLQKNLPLPI